MLANGDYLATSRIQEGNQMRMGIRRLVVWPTLLISGLLVTSPDLPGNSGRGGIPPDLEEPPPGGGIPPPGQVSRARDYRILLKSEEFVPPEGIPRATSKNLASFGLPRVHAILQFFEIPTETEKRELESFGVELLDFIPNFAFYVSLPPENARSIAKLPSVRAITHVLPEDKNPILEEGGTNPDARNPDGTIVLFVVLVKLIPLAK